MNLDNLIKYIKESLVYLIILSVLSHIGYVLARGINWLLRYLLKIMGLESNNIIEHSDDDEDEDVLGI